MQAAQGLQSLHGKAAASDPLLLHPVQMRRTRHFLRSLLLCYHGESIIQHLSPLAQNLRSLGSRPMVLWLDSHSVSQTGLHPLLKHSNLLSCCWHILMFKSTSPYKLDPTSCHGREPWLPLCCLAPGVGGALAPGRQCQLCWRKDSYSFS